MGLVSSRMRILIRSVSFCSRRMRRLNDLFFSFGQVLDDHSSLAAEEHDLRSLSLSFPPLIPFVRSC